MLSKNKIKYIRSLHLKKNREKEGLFIAEGRKIVSEILHSDIEVKMLLAGEKFIEQHKAVLKQKQVEAEVVAEEELRNVSALQNPDDALAVCGIQQKENDVRLLTKELGLYLDGIRDPGNLGTIIRVCDWFGIKTIFCSEDTTELYNPKTIQATMGSFLRVNIQYISLTEVMKALNANQQFSIPVYGAEMEGENVFGFNEFKPGLLVIGNEANGIREETHKLLTRKISIPSFGSKAESLNAAVAASILIAEYRRLNQ